MKIKFKLSLFQEEQFKKVRGTPIFWIGFLLKVLLPLWDFLTDIHFTYTMCHTYPKIFNISGKIIFSFLLIQQYLNLSKHPACSEIQLSQRYIAKLVLFIGFLKYVYIGDLIIKFSRIAFLSTCFIYHTSQNRTSCSLPRILYTQRKRGICEKKTKKNDGIPMTTLIQRLRTLDHDNLRQF